MGSPRVLLAGVIAGLFLGMTAAPCFSEESFTDRIVAEGGLGIDVSAARDVESKLGQLFIVNVDGFGYSGELAVLPGYVAMVKKLQVGGVIPHYASHDFQRIRNTNRALAGLTRLPLLLCADLVGIESAGKVARFGDGYWGGFIGKFAPLEDGEFRTLIGLNAFMFAAIGINTSLGPTVDDSTADERTTERARMVVDALRRCGIEPVLKHFPFLPTTENLHRASPDTKIPASDVKRKTAAFRGLLGESEIMMTTHTFDSLIDGASIVTFSPKWNRVLRQRTGFSGILMSDDLLMLKNYADQSVLGEAANGTAVQWAERAILAGHDFIILAGGASTTYAVFEGLLRVAAGDTEAGRALRQRILESYERIKGFKESRGELLTRSFEAPMSDIRSIVSAVPGDTVSPGFRFSADQRPQLAAAVARASVPRPLHAIIGACLRRQFAKLFWE